MRSVRVAIAVGAVVGASLVATAVLRPDVPAALRRRLAGERQVRVAAIQFDGVPGSVADNADKAERLIRDAAAQGARYILLPEVYALFPKARDHRPVEEVRAEAEPIPGPLTERMVALARTLDVHVAFGMSERRGTDLYNSVALVGPRGVEGTYAKRALINNAGVKARMERLTGKTLRDAPPDAVDEAMTYARGSSAAVVEWGGVRAGVLVCADGGFENFWRDTVGQQAELIVWPTSSMGAAAPWERSIPERARQYGVPIVYANRTRPVVAFGFSSIVDRDGAVVAEAGSRRDAVIVADVTLGPKPAAAVARTP
jgi:predicted amidohydrolase